MKDNPLKPYKAYAAIISAVLASLVAQGTLPAPWDSIVTAILAGLAVFVVPNPKTAEKGTIPEDDTLF